jgi:hypothetical protein
MEMAIYVLVLLIISVIGPACLGNFHRSWGMFYTSWTAQAICTFVYIVVLLTFGLLEALIVPSLAVIVMRLAIDAADPRATRRFDEWAAGKSWSDVWNGVVARPDTLEPIYRQPIPGEKSALAIYLIWFVLLCIASSFMTVFLS